MGGRILAAVLTLIGLLSACSPGKPPSVADNTVDPEFVHGTDGSDIDRLAATILTDLRQYWAWAFPATFGSAWRDLDGGFHSVDTNSTNGKPPPCSSTIAEVEGNAYYCAAVDAIAWDRAALLPVLREHYGEASVVVVLAHEYGHAVQRRSGVDTAVASIRTEAMADCYAGSYVRWVVDGQAPHLRINPGQLDGALRALIMFRDGSGSASNLDPHGTSFDRAAAFQDGYRSGPRSCAAVSEASPAATQAEKQQSTLDQVLNSDAPRAYFRDLTVAHRRSWTRPAVRTDAQCAPGPIALCPQPRSIDVDRDALSALHRDFGDQASATLLGSRYALSTLDDLGRPVAGPEASWMTTCLTGAYLGAERVSPDDLDEAVEVLLAMDGVSRDAAGGNALTGFDRFAAFRTGALGSADACGV